MTDPAHLTSATEVLWQRFRPLVRSRLDLLAAHAAGGPGAPGAPGAADARRVAHALAGSLGSYGRHEGSRLARDLEQALTAGAPPAAVRDLVADLLGSVDA